VIIEADQDVPAGSTPSPTSFAVLGAGCADLRGGTVSTPSPWLLLSGTGMVLVAVLGTFIATRASRSMWRPLAIGAGAWVVAVLLKMIWALPTNAIVRQGLLRVAGASLGKPLYWAYIGLLTGVFECGITNRILGLL